MSKIGEIAQKIDSIERDEHALRKEIMSTKPTVLVLGATGSVGGNVAKLLAKSEDVHVIAGVRDFDKARSLSALGIELRHLDLDRTDTLAPALKNVDRALLLTGYSVDMLKQSKAFLDVAKQTGVEFITHIGASGAPTNDVSHWGWHHFVEAYIETLNFGFSHLQPEAFMQNLLTFGWLNQGMLTNYIANARWSWVSSDDVAIAAAETLRHPEKHQGHTYQLGYDAATMQDIADLLTEIIGKPFQLENRSPEAFLETVLQAGGDPAYMRCVYNQLKLNIANAIPNADQTFDNFEQITGQQPTTWRLLIQQNPTLFTRPLTKALAE
jgi:NAD(P)H dehydrogenase (quinone)